MHGYKDKEEFFLKNYKAILEEIEANKNLTIYLKDVEEVMKGVDKKMEDAIGNSDITSTLRSIKNRLHYLRYEIMERL